LIAVNDKLRRAGCIALLLLIGGSFCLDFFHGIRLGQDQVAFHPAYRIRQSLAVAISRLHDPSPGKYLAYKSVVNVLEENGFAMFVGEPGPHLNAREWAALLADGPRLDRIIQQARDVAIDTSLPPEIIKQNELGLADYIYLSFRIFGDKIASLYYFFYLIVGVSCSVYILQFSDRPFLLYLLAIFIGALYFLGDYAGNYSVQLGSIANSRGYSGLSLLPALHVLFVFWQRRPPSALTVVGVVLQSLIFAFLLSCRTEVAWQLAMVAAITGGVGLSLLPPLRGQKPRALLGRLALLWPTAVFVVTVAAYTAVVSLEVDSRYATEPKGHIIWHEVLVGILSTSPQLRHEYAGDENPPYSDGLAYDAVSRDLKARNDISSPILGKRPDGDLTVKPMAGLSEYDRLARSLTLGNMLMAGSNEYDRLARSLTLRIIRDHPIAVVETVPVKVWDQLRLYTSPFRHGMAWANLQTPVMIVAVSALICMAAGGFGTGPGTRGGAVRVIGVILLFASVTPLIEPSPLSIGSLFCYVGVIAIVIPYALVLLIRAIVGLKWRPEPENVSSSVKSVP
jgi:hypothetical protein